MCNSLVCSFGVHVSAQDLGLRVMDGFGFVQLSRIGAGKFGDVLSHSDSPTIQNIHLVGAKLQDPMGSGPSEGWHQPPKRDTASISWSL